MSFKSEPSPVNTHQVVDVRPLKLQVDAWESAQRHESGGDRKSVV